jgi:phosphohistidine phosphatase
MGQRWAHQHVKPELIIASSAVRTPATARIVAHALAYEAHDIVINERLYAATPDTLMAVIEALDDSLSRVMLVAHNPGLTELAHHFDRKIHDMPTCALVEFKFDTDTWAGMSKARPLHTHVDSPKD